MSFEEGGAQTFAWNNFKAVFLEEDHSCCLTSFNSHEEFHASLMN